MLPRIICLVGIVFLIQCCQKSTDFSEADIVGGRGLEANNPIAQVLLALFDNQASTRDPFCSGVLIDQNKVLTAAHCLAGRNIKDISIARWNSSSMDFEYLSPQIKKTIFYAPRIKDDEFPNFDLVQLNLDRNVNNKDKYELILANKVEIDEKLYLAGFGLTRSQCQLSSIEKDCLGQGKITSMKVSELIDGHRFNNLLKLNGEQTGPCMGDSGGPVFRIENEKLELIGITSGVWHVFNNAVQHGPDQICESGEALASSIVDEKIRSWLKSPTKDPHPTHTDRPGQNSSFENWCLYDNIHDPAWRTTQTLLYHITTFAAEFGIPAREIFENCQLADKYAKKWIQQGALKSVEFDRSSTFFSDTAPLESLKPDHLGFYFNDIRNINDTGLLSVKSILIQSSYVSQDSLCVLAHLPNLQSIKLEFLKNSLDLSCIPGTVKVDDEDI